MKLIIHEWMVNDLKLARNELLVFAVIYNYRRGEWFNIPRKVIAQWAGVTPRAITKIIQRLKSIGVIEHQVLRDSEVGTYATFKIPEYICRIADKYED